MDTKKINQLKQGVCFDESTNTAILKMQCDKECYIETIKSLLYYVGNLDDDFDTKNRRSYLCDLIESMLPDASQID